MLLDMSNIYKKNSKTKTVNDSKAQCVKQKKSSKVDYFRCVELIKKSDLKNKEYVNNEWPLNDIKKINYPKFFCSLESNLNNAKLELNYDDLDTKTYLNNFGISSTVGLKILNSNSKKFKRKMRCEDEFEKFCTSDVNLIDLTRNNVDEMVKPFELKIDRLKNCPLCKKSLSSYHSCLKKSS